ncbi:MAG TPA: GNAT family N-acetyltransferase [Anaerolineales bacterium]|nr:GNAT family N-acetyltransferase [Anaerolineales bacterium]
MIEILPLTPDRLSDWMSLFDHTAFTDNPDWASCYCQFYLADHTAKDWETRSGNENRSASSVSIVTGKLQGFMAFTDDIPIGWCHAAPRTLIPNLQTEPELDVDDLQEVGSIVCYIVAPRFRRQGVARELLEAACTGLQEQGLSIAEAYPRKDAASDASNYHGALSMYLDSGFEVFRELERVIVVRKTLNPTSGN